jgi:hypothetical protein
MNKKIIKRVVKQINPDISVVFNAENNESDILTNKVYYNFSDGWLDEDMIDILRENYRRFPISSLISPEAFIVLHEVGHIESLRHYQTTSVRFALARYARQVNKLIDDDTTPYYLKARRYNELQLERKAHQWACDFIKQNPDIVQDLEKAFA